MIYIGFWRCDVSDLKILSRWQLATLIICEGFRRRDVLDLEMMSSEADWVIVEILSLATLSIPSVVKICHGRGRRMGHLGHLCQFLKAWWVGIGRLGFCQDDNLPRGRLGYVRFEVTTEGCDKPCFSLKAWCVRVKIRRFAEESSDSLESIKIRSQVRWDENILGINLGRREIRDRHCLRLYLKLGILKLGNHIIVHHLIPLMELVEVRAQLINWLGYLPQRI